MTDVTGSSTLKNKILGGYCGYSGPVTCFYILSWENYVRQVVITNLGTGICNNNGAVPQSEWRARKYPFLTAPQHLDSKKHCKLDFPVVHSSEHRVTQPHGCVCL